LVGKPTENGHQELEKPKVETEAEHVARRDSLDGHAGDDGHGKRIHRQPQRDQEHFDPAQFHSSSLAVR
jgi:hypothetical protein